DLVKSLVKILEPFNNTTEYFSTSRYSTIVFIHLLIEAMKVYYIKNINPNEYDNNTKETCDNTIEECRLQLHQLMNVQLPISNEYAILSSTKNHSSNNMFNELIFGSTQRLQELTDELDFYLDLRQTLVAFPDIDPLLWWR
ncbi:41513_t:CDS:2, partial [Gigaspora margarita]